MLAWFSFSFETKHYLHNHSDFYMFIIIKKYDTTHVTSFQLMGYGEAGIYGQYAMQLVVVV